MQSIVEKYTISSKTKNFIFGAIGLGVILIIVGLFMQKVKVEQPDGTTIQVFAWSRFWANYLLSAFYFTAISVLGAAFICIQYLANGGWYVVLKRIFEAISTFLPVALIAFIVLILATFLGKEHGMNALYEWMNTEEVKKDVVLSGKAGYLNQWFWIARLLLYFTLWILFARKLRANSIAEDEKPTITFYNKSMRTAAFFLPIFGFTFCFATWDWMMSIQPHWYSTIFGVNVFAASLVACMTVVNMTAVWMKKNGYMQYVNGSHHHDASKFMFAFSIFWAYTWVAQFLLIWYANLPEEIPYYLTRLRGGWLSLFTINFLLNFLTPFLLFMTRAWKRTPNHIFVIGILILIGKYIDWYLIIMPMSAKYTSDFNALEIGFFFVFAGLFLWSMLTALSKVNLVPKNHPYLEESLHHEI